MHDKKIRCILTKIIHNITKLMYIRRDWEIRESLRTESDLEQDGENAIQK
jgi:hypothetical protein